MDSTFTTFNIEDRTFVAYTKREIHNEVLKGKFSERRAGEIDIVVSELCSNLIKHAGSGQLFFRRKEQEGSDFVEIFSIDSGVGMVDAMKMLRDGMSTSNTLGHGLGSIQRLSDLFQIFSSRGWGTIVYSCFGGTKPSDARQAERTERLVVRGLCIPKLREKFCGDGYLVKRRNNEVQIFFGDGLGHGEFAQQAVDMAGEFFMRSDERDPVQMIRDMHEHVRRSRGLVATIAIADLKNSEWRVCGVGNILTRLYTGIESRNHMSYNGTIGLNIPTTMNYSTYKIEKNQRLIMNSDGLKSRWDIARYPSIMRYDNAVIAAILYKEFNRGVDDSSVLVASVN